MTLVPNRFFYDQSKIRFSKIVLKATNNATTGLGALRARQLDVVYGDAGSADAAARAGFGVKYAGSSWYGYDITDRNGTLSKPLADVRVRQAIEYAIDRKTITSALIGKYGTPTSSTSTLDAREPKDPYPYDPAKAKALLAAAGYPNGFTLSLNTISELPPSAGATQALAVAKYLAAVGIKLTVTAQTGSQWYQDGYTSPKFPMSWNGDGVAFPMWFVYSDLFSPTAGGNPFKFDDPVLDKLYLKAQRLSSKQAHPYWLQMLRRVTTQAYIVPIWLQPQVWFVSPKIGGVALTTYSFPVAVDWYPKR